ncbi:2-hydroxyacid dehydrogenase [Parapedobacter indicus]|uniref:Lactate dehydrogenase n=1 Tax=Parapedobacter indicus TaxID=1477437 RepID=A0A1I3J5J9_9SPHI|nr:D-glycerate dehydrogenase [Parapedobacter indicus]PPL02395.1 lactate dehydrogenase-like 2-hydroxyacid dehydrogenase [Parapedobacter indicus]SFI55248.1 Lactate dehydrogenase [Parapedobacter indicus]
MKIFVTRALPEIIKQSLANEGHIVSEWTEKRDLSPAELTDYSLANDALFSIGKNQIDKHFLTACSHLRVIALCSVGYDHVDVDEATKFGIPIGNTPGVLSKATADTAFLLIQNVARKAIYNHKEILRGNWGFFDPMANLGIELHGKTLGIYGLGRIGFELARSCRYAFDMPVIYYNRSHNERAEHELNARRVSFDELLQQSDVLSVHANLSEETEGIFDRHAFSKMKASSIFINTARGAIHNETDLQLALEEGQIWGAGLDVTHPEPMAPGNPLLAMPTVAILPHIGSATIETRMKMMQLTVENILAGLNGQRLPYCVNPKVYGVEH